MNMNVLNYNLRFRPVRIGWCLRNNDWAAYQEILKLNFITAGGQFNPLIPIDDEDYAKALIKAFRVDLLLSVTEVPEICAFIAKFPYLANAFRSPIFWDNFHGFKMPKFVDISHGIIEYFEQVHKSSPECITYLEKNEMDALLNAPDRSTDQGKRDYAILLFLYNTGTRADEVAQLKITDLDIAYNAKKDFSIVLIRGKGDKLRRCPLWHDTVNELNSLIDRRGQDENVFLSRRKEPLTRFGIHALVRRYVKKLIPEFPSLEKKRVSPHTIRHTTATHLLHAGVDINTIRAWLGHVSINTTNIYVEVDLEMKAKALACCEVVGKKAKKHWRNDKDLMSFLNSL